MGQSKEDYLGSEQYKLDRARHEAEEDMHHCESCGRYICEDIVENIDALEHNNCDVCWREKQEYRADMEYERQREEGVGKESSE